MFDKLKEYIQELEVQEFNKWFLSLYSKELLDTNFYKDRKLVWMARADISPKCKGITKQGCNYLSVCGAICRKCGESH